MAVCGPMSNQCGGPAAKVSARFLLDHRPRTRVQGHGLTSPKSRNMCGLLAHCCQGNRMGHQAWTVLMAQGPAHTARGGELLGGSRSKLARVSCA